MPFSHYTDQALLNSLFGKTSAFGALATAPAVYCALSSTQPTPDGGNVTEPSGGGYTRVAVPAASLAAAATRDPAWLANNPQALNSSITDPNGNQQQATTAGTTGAIEPATWAETTGATTSDGQVTWTNRGQDPDQVTNTAAITFPQATVSWLSGASIVAACFYDAATNGNFLGYGMLTTAQPVLANNTFSFPIGQLAFQNT